DGIADSKEPGKPLRLHRGVHGNETLRISHALGPEDGVCPPERRKGEDEIGFKCLTVAGVHDCVRYPGHGCPSMQVNSPALKLLRDDLGRLWTSRVKGALGVGDEMDAGLFPQTSPPQVGVETKGDFVRGASERCLLHLKHCDVAP